MVSSKASKQTKRIPVGMGELSIVEHALCPLDARTSLAGSLVHFNEYFYTDRNRHKRKAQVRVNAPLGLSASDEFYLWGLLALTCCQHKPTAELFATPHYCLRQLGCIDQHSKRGGRQYRRFAESLERLSTVSYHNDAFYDPARGEHRKVGFGFLSYSLPIDKRSSRAWRIAWDPIFFEFCMAGSQQFRFDLDVYRSLDCASRRLFLLLQKMFSKRLTEARFELHHLAVHVLGFSETLPTKTLRQKCQKTLARLADSGIIKPSNPFITGKRGGKFSVKVERGSYFTTKAEFRISNDLASSHLYEPLAAIGLEEPAIRRFVRDFDPVLVQEWADITLAAKERFGKKFFSRSPQAYFVDNAKQAALGKRTPPDWWHELRHSENSEKRQGQTTSPTAIGEILTQVLSEISTIDTQT
ncbi:MAG TPA: hypothetical protein DDW52_13165 [Planctomycetaceae bacterium]|nr:hypothetical protein [Planctomycetaceae bacterium]